MGIFGNYQMNYLTDSNLYVDIALMMYMFNIKILFFPGWWDDGKKAEMTKEA